MSLKFSAFYHSEAGLRRQNEDAVGMVIPEEPELSRRGMIAAIADGVSGGTRGREAADSSVQALLRDYYDTPPDLPIPQALDNVIKASNARIIQRDFADTEKTVSATTLTALVLKENFYYFSHVGDTRLYRLRGDELEQITIDHVSDQPEKKHLLTRAVGLSSDLLIDHGSGELENGDIFLLATDGVWSALPEHELSWHLSELVDNKRSAEGTARLLIDAALAGGSTDNLSVLVVRADLLPNGP